MPGPPQDLIDALEELASGLSGQRLAEEVERWQALYRDPAADLTSVTRIRPEQAIAYAVYRMPATYAATAAALEELALAMPEFRPESVLDAGGGSGAATWAAVKTFASVRESSLLERDPAMIEVARKIAPTATAVSFLGADLTAPAAFPPADLAVAAYALNELGPSTMDAAVDRLVAAATTVLVVEPGTPRGFATIRSIRDRLLASGMTLAAPCPHDAACPIAGTDWCHFAVRLPRSAVHRRAKRADLGYEDEKFSYVAASKLPVNKAEARVLRHPQLRSGHALLRLCTADDGIQDVTVSKRHGEKYKHARRITWGGRW